MKKGENGKNQRIKTIGYFHFSHGIFYMYFLYPICIFIIHISILTRDNSPVRANFRCRFSLLAQPLFHSIDCLSGKIHMQSAESAGQNGCFMI